MEEVKPRSKLSVWLIGLIFGPVVLMLWLGRGRLALIYVLLQLVYFGLILLVVASGFVSPPAMGDLGTIHFSLSLPFTVVGLIHGLKQRATSLARPWFSRWYVVFILPLAVAWIVFFILLRSCFYQAYNAPSVSMVPGIMLGDHFIVSKSAYGYSRFSFPFMLPDFSGRIWAGEPSRGDIVVFKLPRDNETDYIKRLIGLPGDRIQLRGGVVYLNGIALPLTPVEGIPCLEGGSCNYLRETLPNGRSYVINDTEPNGPADNTAEYIVPPGHYFMMGDNRDNTLDSRFAQSSPRGGVGYVPYENLIGPAVLIFWNSFGIRIDDRLQGYPTK
jgi:signal peptidase I